MLQLIQITAEVLENTEIKGTASVISSDPPSKDGNARLKPLSDQ